VQVLDEELALDDRDERRYDAELHRLRGELLLRLLGYGLEVLW
jgi:hypothetical protein